MRNSIQKRNRLIMLFLASQLGPYYLLYWVYSVQTETNHQLVLRGLKRKGLDKLSGGVVVLFSILSLGIFAVVWQFYMCAKIKRLGGKNIYVSITILTILFIGVIFNPLTIQRELNFISEMNNFSTNLSFS